LITLSNDLGDNLAIWVEGYQYPVDQADNFWDLNWLSVTVRWQRGTTIWQASDPCLTTEELVDLRDWFEKLSDGDSLHSSLGFMEPCLSFEIAQHGNEPVLRIHLAYELDPRKSEVVPNAVAAESIKPINDDENPGVCPDFPLRDCKIPLIIQALNKAIEQFPVRLEQDSEQEKPC
jgi:hypothetical protein